MRVFISWSGERSKAVAVALRDWFNLVVDYVEPWVSDTDIEAGERWGQSIASELAASNFGILCITSENLHSPWVLFEAGALTKSLDDSKVIPLLLDLEFSDISGPLAQFHAKKLDKSGMSEVLSSIQASCDSPIGEEIVSQRFDGMWPTLETKLNAVPKEAPTERKVRPQNEILEELVSGVRTLDSRVRESEERFASLGGRSPRRIGRMHPMMIHEVTRSTGGPEDPVGLLISASLVREDLPWVYELAVDCYRAIQSGSEMEADVALKRLSDSVEHLARGRFPLEEFGIDPMSIEVMQMDLIERTEILRRSRHRERPRRDSEVDR